MQDIFKKEGEEVVKKIETKQIVLNRFDIDGLSDEQLDRAAMFYWACFLGEQCNPLIDFFLKDLGFSPFAPFYCGLSPVVGAIQGGQVKIFKRLVTNSKWNLPYVHHKDDQEYQYVVNGVEEKGLTNKYYFHNEDDKK